MLGETVEISRAHVDGVGTGGVQTPFVVARLRFHRRNELARDLGGLEIAGKGLGKGALDEACAEPFDFCEEAHGRRSMRAM